MWTTLFFLLLRTTLWIDTGWRPVDGEMEYIIQIGPELFEELRTHPEGVTSVIPPEVGNVRRVRVVVGTAILPRERFSSPSSPEPAIDPSRSETTPKSNRLGDRYPDLFPPLPNEIPSEKNKSKNQKASETDPEKSNSSWDDNDIPKMDRKYAPGKEPTTANRPETDPWGDAPGKIDIPQQTPPLPQQGEQPANFEESISPSDQQTKNQAAETLAKTAGTSGRSWLLLGSTLVGLAGSITANVYLATLWLETRRRYRQLAAHPFSGSRSA